MTDCDEQFENAILALLRLKRKKPDEISTEKLNSWQRELEDVCGAKGTELADEYDSMTRDYIKFTNEHVPKILSGDKYKTVRYNWSPSDMPTRGDLIDLKDGFGNKFAEAQVLDTHRTTIESFANREHFGHRNYEDADEMIRHMQTFYDEELGPGSAVYVLTFDLSEREQ